MKRFNSTFATIDTYKMREHRRLETFREMNGEDGDCYFHFMGRTGGPHLRPMITKESGPDRIQGDFGEANWYYNRQFVGNPTSTYGQLFRLNEEYNNKKSGAFVFQ